MVFAPCLNKVTTGTKVEDLDQAIATAKLDALRPYSTLKSFNGKIAPRSGQESLALRR